MFIPFFFAVHTFFALITMERLLSPSTQLHDLLVENAEDNLGDHMVEPDKELILDVSTEEFLSAERGFTFLHTQTYTRC
jgi:hypothetical protein